MNTPETNLQRHAREMRESGERLRAEADPQRRAMMAAAEPTKAERAELESAQAAVLEAEQAVANAVLALDRAQRAQEPTPSGFSFFSKSKESHRAAVVSAAIPDLKVDCEEARGTLQAAIRRRNAVAHRIDQARMTRRAEAKRKHSPPPAKPISRGDRWQAKAFGKEAA